ncbi:DNA binding,ATP binding protein [Artemisia annua]|uniref:DNA binding,ATP binding protein n=1 Tax=Artemisia annua TaxID=35608 RepID=A0A2U1Q1P1_ARTAN|nr:DNA binding,ATP binding protein [Artemisia annua]
MKVTRSSRKRNRKGKVANEKPNNLLDLNIIDVDDDSDGEGILDRGRNSKIGKYSNEDDSLLGLVAVKQEQQLQNTDNESSIGSTSMSAKEHVAEIRRTKFSIGGLPNPLTEDLHQAVKNLSAELYAKDVHCFMELIQNAEDNEYPEGVNPSLEFVITSKDITNTGAPATLLVFNNEKGFSSKNIDSICSVGRSTKKGLRGHGYIGEKGIGFKSVFLITSQPYIFSNGYQIRFNEKPCEHCNVGYIVPEWVEDDTVLSAIKGVYGSATNLPTTTLVLPLKPEKVIPVKKQLSSVHPEALLFLSKIKRLSVREQNDDPSLNTVSAISISSEKNFVTSKSMDADSYLIHLTADDVGNECGYHMWKQRFPVKLENKVDTRQEVEEWVITLAFPIGERIRRSSRIPGIYAFLPTDTETHLPFIIQADFLLASSRENILWDNKWNQGILDCVPDAFLNAFTSLVKSTENAPVSSLLNMFCFLPIKPSNPHHQLNRVCQAIQEKLKEQTIIPCESYTGQKMFRKPNEVGRLQPNFWTILNNSRRQNVGLHNISSHGSFILNSSFDKKEYNNILNFLEIKYVDDEWYAKCISGSNLVMGVSEDVYLELLVFIAENWESFQLTNITNIPIIKYVGMDRKVNLLKMSLCANLLFAEKSDHLLWMTNWNTEFQWSTRKFFLPKATQEAISSCSNDQKPIKKWLSEKLKVKFVTIYEYAEDLGLSLDADHNLVVTYAHFLYNSLERKYLHKDQVLALCSKMPIVDNYGKVVESRNGVLVPANGSKWVELIGSNLWMQHNYAELGEDYTRCLSYCGIVTPVKDIVWFLENYVKAYDIPRLSPPDAAVPTMSSPLTRSNTFLLLNWLKQLNTARTSLPEKFLSSIRNGSWLKICLSGCPGYRPPSESFMLDTSIGPLLQNGSVLVDIPLVDEKYYGDEIRQYKDELRTLGVRFENKEACEFIGSRLMSLATSSKLTKDNVISMLKFIRYLGINLALSEDFVNSIKEGKWLKTQRGYMNPTNSVMFTPEWKDASQISDLPFIDQVYYGKEIHHFKKELEQLGVVVSFDDKCYQLVAENIKSKYLLNSLSSEAFLLILRCIQKSEKTDKLVQAVKDANCLKTNMGYKCPSECFLLNPQSEWIVFYTSLDHSRFLMKGSMEKIGVMVDFEDTAKEFAHTFKQKVSSSSITNENIFSFLECLRKLKKNKVKIPKELKDCLHEEKWLRTKLGDYRSPNECILFNSDHWLPISRVSMLPFIDDSNNFYGSEIYLYLAELKQLGVTTDFKDGAKFVADGLFLPQDCRRITRASVYSLLDSVKMLLEKKAEIPAKFLDNLSQKKWIKTKFGYKRPDECLLFYSDWEPYLKLGDAPFIDEEFYGSEIGSYKEVLNVLGVITDVKMGCKLISSYLNSLSKFESINRAYIYLSEFKWEPANDENKRIWIPRGTKKGEWVTPQKCVINDKNNLFEFELNVLSSFNYDEKILPFFAKVFNVKDHPSVEDYCKLWKVWESSGRKIKNTKCRSFWEFVAESWDSKTEDTFIKNISKLPVQDPNSDAILLIEKSDVFIGDDLYLMYLFQRSSHPTFAWYPQPSMNSLSRTKLVDIFTKIGVRSLSESAQKNIVDVDLEKFQPVNPKEYIIKKGLFKLILGFLADPKLKFEVKRRQGAVCRLLKITAYETSEPMMVQYSLNISSGDMVNVEASRKMEYASNFGEVIADGVLWENAELVPHLSELIRLGYLVDFEEEEVDFLLKIKNLQIFKEDQDYLSSTFLSQKVYLFILCTNLMLYLQKHEKLLEIWLFLAELKQLGVTTDFKDGAKFVANGLCLPQDGRRITHVSVYSLLDSAKKLLEKKAEIPAKFLDNLSQKKWIKTKFGYKRPDECLLFYSDWEPYLKLGDAPFIDEEFYGSEIGSYKEVLNVLGVITDVKMGCKLISSYLNSLSKFESINRVYIYLSEFKWEPTNDENKRIWIPRGTKKGEWVTPQKCVIHDKNNLFEFELNVLSSFNYDEKILPFFAKVFNVKDHPSVDDYCKLWKVWESSGRKIKNTKCRSFWEFVAESWDSKTEDTFIKNISKLPVQDPNSDAILLIEKSDVFIGDDLYLMDLFQRSSHPTFAWYPQHSMNSLSRTKLVDIFTKIGVRSLSESAQKNIVDVDLEKLQPVNSKEYIIKKGLFKLILGFLADPKLKFEVKRRQGAVCRLLKITAYETSEPMMVQYSLNISSGDMVNVEARRMIRWDKKNRHIFFVRNMEKSCGRKMEYASNFGEVIADGVLWENAELVPHLSELIRLGYLVDFEEEEVDFLLKIKNLQIFKEDQDYLSSTFLSQKDKGVKK